MRAEINLEEDSMSNKGDYYADDFLEEPMPESLPMMTTDEMIASLKSIVAELENRRKKAYFAESGEEDFWYIEHTLEPLMRLLNLVEELDK